MPTTLTNLNRAFTTCIITTLLVGCSGGDNGVIQPDSGGTGSVDTTVIGPVSGFGSVIVNGVRYDDSAASISDERGSSLSSSDLRLGMMVRLSGSSNPSLASGTATSISIFSELKGFVATLTASGFTVNGVEVRVVTSTVVDGAAGINSGSYVEVYGAYDPANNQLIASRVEIKTPNGFKLRGVVSNWDNTTSRFNLGGDTIAYSGVTLPAQFNNGASVRVYAASGPTASVWTAIGITSSSYDSSSSSGRAEIKGIVTDFVSLSDFTVNGITVDGSSAFYRDGTAADVFAGAWIEVEGTFDSGRLIATEIEIEDESGSSGGDEFRVTGMVSNFVSAANFTVRNTQIDASQSVRFDDGDITGLANGVCIEVRGALDSGASGTVVRATRIKFDNTCS